MKNIIVCLFILLLVIPSQSQTTEWAFKVLEHSSQEGEKDYSAKQALGMPDVLPASGKSTNAWQPKLNRTEDYIKVGFSIPIIPKQILIAESYNPGYISKIYVYDITGKELLVASFEPSIVSGSRLLQINSTIVTFPVNAVKLILIPGIDIPIGIDAIGITESDQTIAIQAPQPGNIKTGLIPVRLGNTVNTPYMEIGPLPTPDGKTLYFSRRGDPDDMGGKRDYEDIWYSNWNDSTNNWSAAINMGPPLNNKYPNFIASVSPDGNTILLGNTYLPSGTMLDGVSMSKRTTTDWSFPKALYVKDGIDNESRLTDFFLSNSQKILLISAKSSDDTTYGNRDIYVSFLVSDTVWSKPINLGHVINTKGIEMAPFLASDDKTLYYATTGIKGYGGSDIYISRRLDDSWKNWSVPENMGPVINTAGDESYLTMSASGDKVYYTSSSGENNSDIYTLIIPAKQKPQAVTLIKGRVINSKTNEAIPDAKIHFENLISGIEIGIATSNPISGSYQIVLPSGSKYGYLAQKQGFISVHANLDLTKQTEYAEITRDLYLSPIEVGQTITFNNIFFDFDKYVLLKESYLELDRLAKVLKANPTMQIIIAGYTDNIGSASYNDVLGSKRAEAVMNYLVMKSGANKSRITVKSFGKTHPVASNKTIKGRQLNRRVEFTITKM
jgi:OOP family OmpA-OmpF porin